MNKNKLNLRNVLAIAICLVISTAFIGCDNKEKPADENPLVGKWVTAGNDHNHIEDGRVIVFTEDLRVEQYFWDTDSPHKATYSISGNQITFTLTFSDPYNNATINGGFRFILNGNYLTIKLFSRPFYLDALPRSDVHFTRIE